MSESADIYISNRLTVPKGFYEYCKSKFSKIILVDPENNEIDTSPDRKSNNKEIYKLRKNTNFRRFYQGGYFQLLLSTSKRIEHHTYYVNRSINLDGRNSEEFNFTLYNFHLLTEDKHIRVKNTGVDIYEIGTNAMAGLGWNRYLLTYPQNIFKMFQRSELKYLNLYEYKDIEELSFMYKYRAVLETVLNLGEPGCSMN